jgi:hypothetical protein
VLVSFLAAGCIGPFTLSRGLGRWNARVGNKWEAQLVFMGLVVLHAYQITGLIDLVILNPIAFWRAPNSGPMIGNDATTEIPIGEDRHVLLSFSEEAEVLHAKLFEQGKWIDSFRVTRHIDGSMSAENMSGQLSYESREVQSGIRQVNDREGKGLFSYSPDLIDRRILEGGGGGGLPPGEANADTKRPNG